MALNLDRELRRQFREQQKYLRQLKKYVGKSRPYKGFCEKCGKETQNPLQKHDDTNMAQNYWAMYLCPDCYNADKY